MPGVPLAVEEADGPVGGFLGDAILNTGLLEEAAYGWSQGDWRSPMGIAGKLVNGVGMVAGVADAGVNVATLGVKAMVLGVVEKLGRESLEAALKTVVKISAKGEARLGTLSRIGKDAWESSGGLRYSGLDKHGLNRIEHVLRHTVAGGPGHSVFSVPRNQVLGLLDQAWASSSRIALPGDPAAFITPMGRTVGTAGENAVRLIVKPGTTNVISAYPVVYP